MNQQEIRARYTEAIKNLASRSPGYFRLRDISSRPEPISQLFAKNVKNGKITGVIRVTKDNLSNIYKKL